MRHTKIVATVGPASNSPEMIEALLLAGVDLFRLNFSHGTHASHAAAYQTIRDASARTGQTAAIMQDLSGPKIRTGSLAGGTPLTLRDGDELTIVAGDCEFDSTRSRSTRWVSSVGDDFARGPVPPVAVLV